MVCNKNLFLDNKGLAVLRQRFIVAAQVVLCIPDSGVSVNNQQKIMVISGHFHPDNQDLAELNQSFIVVSLPAQYIPNVTTGLGSVLMF